MQMLYMRHDLNMIREFPLTCSKLLPPLRLVAMILLKVGLKHNKSINLELLGLQKKYFRFNLTKNIADTGILVSHWPIYKNKFSSENTVKIGVRVTVFDSTFNNILTTAFFKLISMCYGSWIYNYLCNQCITPLKFLVRIPIMV
jgi:hypothetical protein